VESYQGVRELHNKCDEKEEKWVYYLKEGDEVVAFPRR